MVIEDSISKKNWLQKSQKLLQMVCTPEGIKASLTNKDNYGAIFTRDAVMAGIAGTLLEDEIIIEGFRNTLFYLKKLQGNYGQIASNYIIDGGVVDKVSFGILSPKIDACTWYLVGVGLLLKEGRLNKDEFRDSIKKTIGLLNAWEYNGKHLIYTPNGGNWADEYVYSGYTLYDQILRIWGLSLLATVYDVKEWAEKSRAIEECLENYYQDDKRNFYYSSISPGGMFKKFDLAAHALTGIVVQKENVFVDKALDWIFHQFIEKNNLPPAFYPVIDVTDPEWEALRGYHVFDFKNKPHHYHNGGIWWIWLGWLSVALSLRKKDTVMDKLTKSAFSYLNSTENFNFDEYISGDKLALGGTKKLSYTATGIVFLSLATNSFNFSKLKP